MSYTEDGDHVYLEMTGEDFDDLLLMLGYAIGANPEKRWQYRWLALANRMNEGNPRYTPYEIPEEFRK